MLGATQIPETLEVLDEFHNMLAEHLPSACIGADSVECLALRLLATLNAALMLIAEARRWQQHEAGLGGEKRFCQAIGMTSVAEGEDGRLDWSKATCSHCGAEKAGLMSDEPREPHVHACTCGLAEHQARVDALLGGER